MAGDEHGAGNNKSGSEQKLPENAPVALQRFAGLRISGIGHRGGFRSESSGKAAPIAIQSPRFSVEASDGSP